MSPSYDIAAFRARIGAIRVEDNATLVKQKSRDFYWYSPVLKRELDNVTADLMVTPANESEVKTVLAAAYRARHSRHAARRRDRQLRAGDAAQRRRAAQPQRHEQGEVDRARPRGRQSPARC